LGGINKAEEILTTRRIIGAEMIPDIVDLFEVHCACSQYKSDRNSTKM
jgi:hypothetical protein